jgi:bacterial/archaeal transporter family-2 protein
MSSVSYAIWAFAAGALIPLMALLNAGLARTVGGQVQATVVLFAVGLAASLLLALIFMPWLASHLTSMRAASS